APLSKLHSNATLDTTSKCDACRADKIVTKEEACEKEVSKASSSKTQPEKSKANASKTQPMKLPKASTSEAVKSSKANTLEIKSGKVFKAVGPKANGKDKASNSAKKVTRIESDEDSEEELLAKTRKLLATPSVPPPTTSPSKSPRMQVEVILKSPAPAKPKNGKSTSAIKAKSKLQRAPMADHDSDEEVVEEPRCKHKAQDPPDELPAKQQRLTGTCTPAPVETDEEQELERLKARARPKPCPPPAPKPEVETQPESAEDKDHSNERSLCDPTPKPEPEVKQPAKGTKAKLTSSKAHRKHSSRAPTPHPQAETDQAAEETEPDPEPSKQKSTRRSKVPECPSEVDKPKEDEDEDEDEDGLKPERKPPKKRSRQDQCAQSPEASDPTPEVEKATTAKKAAFKSAPKPTASKTSEDAALPLEPMIIDGS
ncbi:hypothetical protein FRC11_011538, partial [Ceratobasidium sp. 423]